MGPSRKTEGPAGSPRDRGLRSYYQQPALPAALGCARACVCVCVCLSVCLSPDASEEAEGRGSGKEGNRDKIGFSFSHFLCFTSSFFWALLSPFPSFRARLRTAPC